MIDKLDFLVRFWQLRSRYEELGAPLTSAERGALLSLVRLVAADQRLPDPGPPPRCDDGLPVQLTAPRGFLSAELRVICAEGIVLACATTVPAGQRSIVRLADAVSGVEYALPCVVEWSFVGRPSAIALRVDGAPSRTSFAVPQPGMWRTALAWSEPPPAMAQ